MAFKKRTDILKSVYNELALVAGTSVQTYSEPQVLEAIQAAFDHLFAKAFWDHLTATTIHSLDGTVGVTTDAILQVSDLGDIKWVRKYPYRECDDLTYFADGIIDPDSQVEGYTGIPVSDTAYYETKRIKILPPTASFDIAVRARRKPENFGDNSFIPFDDLCMKHLVCANLLAIDGLNQPAQMREEALFEDRFATLVTNMADKPIRPQSRRFAKEFTVAS